MISKLRSYRLSRVTDLVTYHLLWNDEQYLLDIRAQQSQVLDTAHRSRLLFGGIIILYPFAQFVPPI